jgi:3'-phosphoadenosine 5'-phosphosulfate sulfotransferase (PAPS reductase)/FAD synthetase
MKRIVGFSGGIDSQATALVVRRQFPADEIILLNSTAGGNEHPITAGFIAEYSADVFPVTVVEATIRDLRELDEENNTYSRKRDTYQPTDALTFDRLAEIIGRFPSRNAQFCTNYLKLAPSRRWCRDNLGDEDFERYVGIRRDESPKRAKTPDSWWDEFFDCQVYAPVAGWTKQQCFDFVREAGEPVNPLYTMGFDKVGCAPCVNSGKDDIRMWAARFPEMIDKVREWERRTGKTFFPPIMPDGKGGSRFGFVDEVVEWSRTTRGGKQYELPIVEAIAQRGECSSSYGLCE